MFNIKISRAIFKLLIIAQIVIVSSQIQAEITVAVLNFANRATGVEQQKYNWLEKGLTDLIINDLSSYEGFRVVTREHMQMLMEEREILNTLSLPNDVRRSIGRSLQVDYLVFGTFGVDKNGLVLEAKVINVDDSRVIASLTEQSSLDQVLIMEKNLAGDLIVCLKGKGVSQNIVHQLPRWTDSVPATEYLYNGVDYFDKGLYTKAWYYFRKAIHNDPNFADARYWLARMSYYRQEYGHARVEYEQFVNNFPSHPRIGDAIIEFVHSYERTIDDPDTLLKFYQEARKQDWGGNRVYHQADYINWSPLYDWLIKREQQTLKFKHEYGEAFSLLLSGIEYNIPVYERGLEHRLRSWQNESVRLMASAAVESEDRFNRRLTSTYLPYKDIALSVNMPRAGKDIAKKEGLCGGVYKWGCNYRILAPEGFSIKKIKATVMRTNDPKHDAVCRLQIRRYRYVDIDSVWTTNKTKPEDLTRTITMPPGCTWFYLRPEYLSRAYRIGISQVKNIKSSFDGWRIEAELEPLGPVGRIGITVDNCSRYEVLVDGVYARCFDGIITNLIPGKHKIEVRHTHNSAYLPQEKEVEIKADEIISLELSLPFKHEVKEEGWQNPTSVARQYPWFKHRPARVARLGRSRESALRGIRPTICRTRSGVFVVIWSFLDDLWMATSKDGKKWNVPVNISPPVNSAHVEMAPRLIEDEQGRYCLMFLSDRGLLRDFSTYVCWTKDLVHWSRPILVTSAYNIDHDFLQTLDGRYVIAVSEKVEAERNVINLFVSRNLLQWEKLNQQILPDSLRKPGRLCIRQDKYGVFYLVCSDADIYGRKNIVYSSSSNLINWASPVLPDRGKNLSSGGLAAQIIDDDFLVGIGRKDLNYSSHEVSNFLWRPIGLNNAKWQTLSMPAQVVDAFFDFVYNPDTDEILFIWRSVNMTLNETLPSGPIFSMLGKHGALLNKKTKVSP